MMPDQQIHDFIGIFAAVVYIADDMQRIDGEPLDQPRHRIDELFRPAQFDDGGENFAVICLFVEIVAIHIDQFVDDIVEISGQSLAHLAARVLGGDGTAYLDKAVQLHAIPIFIVRAGGFLFRDNGGGVINKGAELVSLALGHRLAVQPLDLFPDDTGAVVHDVAKRLVLAVQIAQKMLRTLRQTQNRFQIDHFRRRSLQRRVLFGNQTKVLPFPALLLVSRHIATPFFKFRVGQNSSPTHLTFQGTAHRKYCPCPLRSLLRRGNYASVKSFLRWKAPTPYL